MNTISFDFVNKYVWLVCVFICLLLFHNVCLFRFFFFVEDLSSWKLTLLLIQFVMATNDDLWFLCVCVCVCYVYTLCYYFFSVFSKPIYVIYRITNKYKVIRINKVKYTDGKKKQQQMPHCISRAKISLLVVCAFIIWTKYGHIKYFMQYHGECVCVCCFSYTELGILHIC